MQSRGEKAGSLMSSKSVLSAYKWVMFPRDMKLVRRRPNARDRIEHGGL